MYSLSNTVLHTGTLLSGLLLEPRLFLFGFTDQGCATEGMGPVVSIALW